MHDLAHRLAIVLLACAALAAFLTAWTSEPAGGLSAAHRQWILVALASALAAAVVLPWLRTPAIGAALATKLAYLAALASVPAPGTMLLDIAADVGQALILAVAGTLFFLEARREARWDGVLPLRQES